MDRHALASRLIVAVCLSGSGCERAEPAAPENQASRQVAPAQTRAVAPEKATERPKRPKKGISAMAIQQAEALGKRFRAPMGTPLCDTDALARLQLLEAQHGTPTPIRNALLAAYEGCNERVALAELLRDTMGEVPTDDELLAVGNAWIDAVRFGDAARVLEPLAARLGDDSQAAWSYAMALAYLGEAESALPRLQAARSRATGPSGVDAHTLIALSLLELDRVDEAIAELEAGLELAPNHPPMFTLASRAYTAAGRPKDAERTAARAREAHAKIAAVEQPRARADAMRRTLNAAWKAERFEEVEKLIDEMWPTASPAQRVRLLKNRAALYERTKRPAKAKAARRELEKLMKEQPKP